jgi:1,4-dihydroxy-6-naphthoate synthase
MKVRLGYSPDPDDAFMLCGLVRGRVPLPGIEIETLTEELESLNRRARAAELEVTAISVATYLLVADRYRIVDAGAALATDSGPIVVAREPLDASDVAARVVAIPGSHTTASLLLRIYGGDPPLIEVPFEKIPAAVREGQADLGLLIHEGELTHRALGLVKVLDLGERWRRDTGLPLPLGLNVVRRDLDESIQGQLAQALRDSVAWARVHVDEALDHAMAYARGMDRATCRRFVDLYVNEYAAGLGTQGRAALARLFTEAQRRGLIERVPPLDPC